MNPFKLFGKKDKDQITLKKTETGDWMVQKGYSILYIGSKEKCETYIKQAQTA